MNSERSTAGGESARSPADRTPPSQAAYVPLRYWQGIHEQGGLAGVANPLVPESLNRWFYRNWSARLSSFVRKHRLEPQTVFDVGSGTGFWVDWWKEHGSARVDGCDLSPTAVERLRARYGPNFYQLDVASDALPGTYDLVLVMNVLLHVTDPAGFERALGHIAAAVRPGGHLLLMEPVLSGSARWWEERPATANSRARSAKAYIDPLRASGLRLVVVEPATALGSDPIETGRRSFRYWHLYWRMACGVSSRAPILAPMIGLGIRLLDPLCLRLGAAPSEKFVLLRRPGAAGS